MISKIPSVMVTGLDAGAVGFDNSSTSFVATDLQSLGEEIDGLISEVTATHKFSLDANGVLILEEL